MSNINSVIELSIVKKKYGNINVSTINMDPDDKFISSSH